MQDCLFCNHDKFELVGENEFSYAIRDKFPLTELHTLIISKMHYETVFDLSSAEMASILDLTKMCRDSILKQDGTVQGFNFVSNAGEVAGQKIHHVHFHLIPRREGDSVPSVA